MDDPRRAARRHGSDPRRELAAVPQLAALTNQRRRTHRLTAGRQLATLIQIENPRRRSVIDACSTLADHADPVSLETGRLIVAVDQPGWATQLRFLAPDLLAKIAERIGPGVVEVIDVRMKRFGGSK